MSRLVSQIGERAGVKVDERLPRGKSGKTAQKVPVWASAHDLRRAFGYRWAQRVMPMVLKELMRHQSVTTTERFYVGVNAQQTAKFLKEVTKRVTITYRSFVQSAAMSSRR